MLTRSTPEVGHPLPRAFYARGALVLSRALIGRLLVHREGRGVTAGRIVEVEAYRGPLDPASHAFRGPTARNAVMFGPPGHAYVYFTYGMHYCLNVVAETDGRAAAVLIRALAPEFGVATMQARRGETPIDRLMAGPACVTRALGLGRADNGADLTGGALWVSDLPPRRFGMKIVRTPRIGIRHGVEFPWRFHLDGHPSVSGRRATAQAVAVAARRGRPRRDRPEIGA